MQGAGKEPFTPIIKVRLSMCRFSQNSHWPYISF